MHDDAPSHSDSPAEILSRHDTQISPWVTLREKAVRFAPGQPAEIYHTVAVADYIAILARTPSGRIPLVRQFRPAVETYTWELPAGLVDPGEDPEQTCRRELKEETGLEAHSITYLGGFYTDSGRLENRHHSFFVETSEPDPDFVPEAGMEVDYVRFDEIKSAIKSGRFCVQLHIAVLFLYELKEIANGSLIFKWVS